MNSDNASASASTSSHNRTRANAGTRGTRSGHRRAFVGIAVSGALLLGLAGCSGSSGQPATTPSSNSSATDGSASGDAAGGSSRAITGEITVFAAASLKGTFTELATQFEAENPGTTVVLNFAGSSDLVTQITEGAPADVFASADTKNMTKLTDQGLVDGDPVDFATNVLEIAVPPGNPADIATLSDLARAGVKTVVCAPQVPCGSATATIESASGVDIAPVSEESSVTDVLGKVTSGEADAGLVYVTDVKAAGDAVTGIPFPESSEAVNTYPIAGLTDSATSNVAQAFIQFVTGPAGRSELAAAGFGAPPTP